MYPKIQNKMRDAFTRNKLFQNFSTVKLPKSKIS